MSRDAKFSEGFLIAEIVGRVEEGFESFRVELFCGKKRKDDELPIMKGVKGKGEVAYCS